MLQINDLRFGNLVTWVDEKEDYPLTISGILSKEDVFVEWVWKDGETDNTDCGLDNIRPINITKDILKKMGFNSNIKETIWHKPINNDGDLFTLNYVGGVFEFTWGARQVNFVHQLQNLWYSLTGSELEVVW